MHMYNVHSLNRPICSVDLFALSGWQIQSYLYPALLGTAPPVTHHIALWDGLRGSLLSYQKCFITLSTEGRLAEVNSRLTSEGVGFGFLS